MTVGGVRIAIAAPETYSQAAPARASFPSAVRSEVRGIYIR